VTVLVTVDESSYTGGSMGMPHPISWYHAYDGGRAWYTAMGHTAESYAEPAFLEHLAGGIMWAAGS
jgi:type 1 glutamine amidotransferase